MTAFSVDTHLFRELGDLLVGRQSTALIELVKNAYDADATEVVVFGQHLGEPSRGVIRISDDGVGMDLKTFTRGFMRVASRMRDEGDRRSTRYGRRYTGAKGIGRLAAHKLAKRIDVLSVPWTGDDDEPAESAVKAHIDWDEVEKAETLDEVSDTAISAVEEELSKTDSHGTKLTLTRVRQKWTKAQLGKFLLEVEALRAPDALCSALPASVVPKGGILGEPRVVDASSKDPGFNVKLEGEFETGDSYWPAVIDAANWLLEIEATAKTVRYAVAPTRRALDMLGKHAKPISLSEANEPEAPSFHARIFIREGGPTGKRDERSWATRLAGVRVYMEGFRVLPYGEDTDDWLLLSRDTNERTRSLRFLEDSSAAARIEEVDKEGLSLLPNKHYFGAVFLTSSRAGSLKMLVNREGFVPDAAFELLVKFVRRGIDIATRVRAAARVSAAEEEARDQPGVPPAQDDDDDDDDPNDPDEPPAAPKGRPRTTLKEKIEGSLQRLTEQATSLESLADSAPPSLAKKLRVAAAEISRATQISRDLIPANSMVLVLASVGTQLAAFTHEVNRLLSLASDLEAAAARLKDQEMPPKLRAQVSKLSGGAGDLRRAVERQAAYLIDIVTPDARRRRSRQKIKDVLESTWRLVAPTAERRSITFQNEVDADHKSPPLFRAELMAVFSNLLTNAVKAAGTEGTVRATSSTPEAGALVVRLENTGVAVDLDEAERWFRPFESTTVEADPVLGQGMGLGLTITRDLLSEVGATIAFVKPRKSFSTAIEIAFPGGS